VIAYQSARAVDMLAQPHTTDTRNFVTLAPGSQRGSSTSLPVIRSSMGRRRMHRRALASPTLLLGLNKRVDQRMIATAKALLSVRLV